MQKYFLNTQHTESILFTILPGGSPYIKDINIDKYSKHINYIEYIKSLKSWRLYLFCFLLNKSRKIYQICQISEIRCNVFTMLNLFDRFSLF